MNEQLLSCLPFLNWSIHSRTVIKFKHFFLSQQVDSEMSVLRPKTFNTAEFWKIIKSCYLHYQISTLMKSYSKDIVLVIA